MSAMSVPLAPLVPPGQMGTKARKAYKVRKVLLERRLQECKDRLASACKGQLAQQELREQMGTKARKDSKETSGLSDPPDPLELMGTKDHKAYKGHKALPERQLRVLRGRLAHRGQRVLVCKVQPELVCKGQLAQLGHRATSVMSDPLDPLDPLEPMETKDHKASKALRGQPGLLGELDVKPA
jgi:hypothetical protein